MPKNSKIYALKMTPGIQRDGTSFNSDKWTDGQWVRFYRGLPRKITGYSLIRDGIPNFIRGIYVVPTERNFNIFFGVAGPSSSGGGLYYMSVQISGAVVTEITNIPLLNFNLENSNDIQFRFDLIYSTASTSSTLVVHTVPDLNNINTSMGALTYEIDAINPPTDPSNPVMPIQMPPDANVSGGVVVLQPYTFYFGSNGSVSYSAANDPTNIINTARISGTKIVAGFPMRGGNSSPAGLFWSLDSVIRCTYTPLTNPTTGDVTIAFTFDTVTADSSILSGKSVVEYDSYYYWPGADRFLVYGGVVQELPNNTNLQYFYTNLDLNYPEKVWGTKVTSFGEIWWFFPNKNLPGYGANGVYECNDAIIYNVREKSWYNCNIGRSCGYYNQVFQSPVWAGNVRGDSGNIINQFGIWQQEVIGLYDQKVGININFSPVNYISTSNLNATYNNGNSGVGSTLTASSVNVPLIIDGHTFTNADVGVTQILIKGQTNPIYNGIYLFTQLQTATLPWVLTRSTSYNTPALLNSNLYFVVIAGNTYIGTRWKNTTSPATAPFFIGISPITYAEIIPTQNNTYAIPSSITSGSIAWCSIGPNKQENNVNRWVGLYSFEPDFILTGNLTLTILGREYAGASTKTSTPNTILPGPTSTFTTIDDTLGTQFFTYSVQFREMRLQFSSNSVGGNYEMGTCLMEMYIGDDRP